MAKYLFPAHLAALLFTTLGSSVAWSALDNAVDVPAQNVVIVTAARVAQEISAALAPVSVLERADIERLQANDFSALLARLPGIDLSRDGGPGASTSLHLRGTNNEHTLFLIDGQRVSSATLGSTSFQFIDPTQIEKIEAVRGPKSSLYGSDAIGGVIQIFTRRASAEPSAYVSAGYGAYDSYQVTSGGQGQWQRWHYAAHVAYFATQGIQNLRENTPPNGANDPYRNASGSFNVGYDFSGGTKLDLDHFYTRSKNTYGDPTLYDGVSEPYSENWIQNSVATLHTPLSKSWQSTWSLARSIDDSDTFDKKNIDPSGRSALRTTRTSVNWQNDFAIGKAQTLSAGVDYYDEHLDSNAAFVDTTNNEVVHSRDNAGYFAQYLLSQDNFDIQAGLRQDDNEAFGHKNTRNIALGLALPAQHRLIFSYGTAFKAPTLNALYFPLDTFGDHGNPNVKPENSENYEIDLRGDYQTLQWAFNVFENRIKDLIQWAPIDPSDPFRGYRPNNVATAKIRGAEFTVNATLRDCLIAASLSYIDPRDESTDNVLPTRARRNAKFDIDRPFGNWSLGASWNAHDSRYADVQNSQRLGGFGLVDLRASYKISSAWLAQLKLDNIFDKNYVLNRSPNNLDYNQPRFGWFATLTYRL
jgi:vitamin B12 transporter